MKDGAVATFDFLVGFTIFIIAFIYVATMVPHTLFAVQSSRIDFDAVAYRTGVILTEDPGMPAVPDFPVWEQRWDPADVVRMGLAVEPGSPHILSLTKVDRFFDPDLFSYPDDYRHSLIFGDYPYSFNITLTAQGVIRSIGPPPPESYGTVRRVVVVKEPSLLSIDGDEYPGFHVIGNATPDQRFKVEFYCDTLYPDRSVEAAYRIDPRIDPLQIEIKNFSRYLNESTSARLTDITIRRQGIIIPFTAYTLWVDGHLATPPTNVSENLFFTLNPVPNPPWREKDIITITFVFNDDPPEALITGTQIYDHQNVTFPTLQRGTLEVAIW